jgi:hypothetical protein
MPKKPIKKTPNKSLKKVPKLPKVEKQLKDFIGDEEGKMTKKDVAKLGVSLAVLGMMMQPDAAQAGGDIHSNGPTHVNTLTAHNPVDNCATHHNVTSHGNHSNHSNHSDGGWMC